METLRQTGGFGPQSLPERQLEKKPITGFSGFFSLFIALEEQVFVYVLSKKIRIASAAYQLLKQFLFSRQNEENLSLCLKNPGKHAH